MEPEIAPTAGLLVMMSLVLLAALATTSALRSVAAARVGKPLYRVRAGSLRRRLILAGLGLLAALTLVVPGAPTLTALFLLGLTAALALLTPAPGDTIVGADGVQAGWHVSRLADVEEWRLTGEHLRWRKHGEWLACHLPAEHHEVLRGMLETLAPERESSFKH